MSGVPRPCLRLKATPPSPRLVRGWWTPRCRRTHARSYVLRRDLRSSFCPGSRTGAAEGRRIPYPMVHGMKKSDEAGVPMKAANKGAKAPAELPEGRASTKGNSQDQSTSTGDLRFPRFHALLQEEEERKLRAGAQADSETGHANLETGQGETPRADARGCPRHGAMAGESGQRMVELLCRADQRPGSSRFREASFVDLAQNLARAVTEGSDHDSRGRTPRGPVSASRKGPASLANRAICRQPPKVGAVFASAHVRICAGGPG